MAFAVDMFEQFCPAVERLTANVALYVEMISRQYKECGITTEWGQFTLEINSRYGGGNSIQRARE